MARPRKNLRRRGALLIVVLSILVLFALIALTFVVVAGTFNRSAKAAGRIGITDDEGRQLVERAFYELLRGTTNTNSQLFDTDTSNTNLKLCNSLFEDLYGNDWVKGTLDDAGDPSSFPGFIALPTTGTYVTGTVAFVPRSDYYSGRVLTMLSGPCALLSTRIVRFDHTSNIFLVEPFKNELGVAVTPADEDVFIINGAPFNGRPGDLTNNVLTLRDPDEDYDAPDVNNPHLAFITTTATTSADIIASFIHKASITAPLGAGTAAAPTLMVDNDGDGIKDSVWLNFDFPIKATSDGRRYRPYVAILCQDLDGRANLNAHGSLAQVHGNYTANASRYWANLASAEGLQDKNITPRGMGAGPADVNLANIVGSGVYQAFLQERYKSPVGSDQVPGAPGGNLLLKLQNFGIPDSYTAAPSATAPNTLGSPIDLHGRGMIGVDFAGRPMTHFMGTGELTENPYLMNLTEPSGDDTPYTAADLEAVLRWRDVDTKSLSRRLTTKAPALIATAAARRSVTTHSFRIPAITTPVHILDRVADRMGSYDQAAIQKMLPVEMLHGMKMDVNRPWGNGYDDNGNGVIDEPAETGSETIFGDVYSGGTAANYINGGDSAFDNTMARQLYARNLFCLMMFLMDKDPSDTNKIAYRIPLTRDGSAAVVETALTPAQHYQLTVRRIAQWAINCVDFRDSDAIMTPFEYDPEPFNGWGVDGDLTTEATAIDRGVVWGAEYPDLVMTESLAFHDRRIRDTEWDDRMDIGAAPDEETPHPADPARGTKRIHPDKVTDPMSMSIGDSDLDQVRMPQGSLFLEFYNVRNKSANNPTFPRELYDNSGKLDLNRRETGNAGTLPVWRVVISSPHHSGTTDYSKSPAQQRLNYPDSATFEPDNLSLVTADQSLDKVNRRFIYFSTAAPSGTTQGEPEAKNTYYNKGGASSQYLLAPGEYLVVGPREETVISATPTSEGTAMTPAPVVTADGDQVLTLSTSGSIAYTNLDGDDSYPLGSVLDAEVAPPKVIHAVTDATDYGFDNGVNVSEPLPTDANAYPPPTHARAGVTDAYGNGTTPTYLDEPLDGDGGRPLEVDNLLETGTTPNYRSAHLQRLANPLAAWNAVTNPYITVDWIPIDLTVFNGEDREPETWDSGAHGEWDEDDPDQATAIPKFGSRETADQFYQNVLSPNYEAPSESIRVDAADECFQFDFTQAAAPSGTNIAPRDTAGNSTIGYLNSSLQYGMGPTADPPGEPPVPFPWLTWFDRPFTNHYELLLVPAAAPNRILHEFTIVGGDHLYEPAGDFKTPFGHLLNFYHTRSAGNIAPHFYRLLEYIEAPNRFAGASAWFDPATVSVGTFAAPAHRISRFRDPGLININTIPGQEVWTSVANNTYTRWEFNFDNSRRTDPSGTVNLPYGWFNAPFRGSWNSATASDVEKTMLRSDPFFGGPTLPLMSFDLFAFDYASDYSKNAYFFFQGLFRQANLLSTQSNAYSVWITVAYFEVDPATGNPTRELGQDVGNTQRHRGFFVVDRSVPVAFERGQNHNIDRAILLRRFIE